MKIAKPSRSITVTTSSTFIGALAAAALLLLGCGNAVRPRNPRVPGATARLVDRDAPFIVDWETQQTQTLDASLRSSSIGVVVVSYRRNTIRLLPDCWLSGFYTRSATARYAGMLQVRSIDSLDFTAGVRVDALQQISTSANVSRGTLLDYRYVLAGRYEVGGNLPGAGLLDLAERSPFGCRGATHYLRSASIGAFERLSDAYGNAGAQASAFGVGASAAGQSQQTISARGGDYDRCMRSGNPADPACSALLKIDLAPVQPARVGLAFISYAVSGQPAPYLRFRFSPRKGYPTETPAYPAASWALTSSITGESSTHLKRGATSARKSDHRSASKATCGGAPIQRWL